MKKESVFSILLYILINTFLITNIRAQEIKESLTINDDGSVIFRYYDDNAHNVKVYCDGRLRCERKTVKRENYHKAKMHKDSNNVWTYTTPPLPPEVYTYYFKVDEKKIADPLNPDNIRVRTDRMSVFVVAKTPQSLLYITDSLHGNIDTLTYNLPNNEKNRNLVVYTPPTYYDDTLKEYPVLYLLHGLNGNENAWEERGRSIEILDNLIVENKAQPMILVLPDANPECLISQKEEVGLVKNILLYPSWGKREFEMSFSSIDSFLSTKYRLLPVKGGRAVAGLSAGAKQSANLANMYDSTFKFVGLFSPVVKKKQLPDDLYSRYWIGGGSGDLFHLQINRFRKMMHRRHIPYTMYNSVGGHTWRNWRVYFSEFVQTIKF